MMIAEELLLLITDDDSGRIKASWLDYGLAGAVLAELALMGRVRLTERGEPGTRPNRVVVTDDSPTDNPIFDDVLHRLGGKSQFRSNSVNRISRHLRKPLQQRLVDAGVLTPRRSKFMGFAYTRFVQANPDPEIEVRMRLHHVLVEGAEPDPSTAALIAVLAALGHVHKAVPRGDRRAMNRRAKELRKQYWAAETAYQVIQATQAAVVAAASSS